MSLVDVSVYSVLLPLFVGAYYFRHLTPALKAILFLILIGCITEGAMQFGISGLLGGDSGSLLIYTAYSLLEYLLISLFYYLLARDALHRKIIFGVSIAFVCFFFGLLRFNKDSPSNFSVISVVESIVLVLWVLLYFRQLITHQLYVDLKKSPPFWISVGFLLYFLGTFFLFASFTLLLTDQKVAVMFYEYINSALNILNHLLICIGFYFSTRN